MSESYAERKLGWTTDMFSDEAKQRLDLAYKLLEAAITPEEQARYDALDVRIGEIAKEYNTTATIGTEPNIGWVIDEVERRRLCPPEEIAYLRENFISDSGLPMVL